MHGYRAFPDVLNSIVTASGRTLRVNLFQDCDWSDGEISLSLAQGAIVQRLQPAASFTISVRKADGKPRILALRQPSWSRPMVLALNGKPIQATAVGGYAQVERVWQAGDKIEVQFPSLLRLVLRDGRVVPPNALGDQAVDAALHWGPWLMGVDEHHDALFFGEPWEDNVIFLPQSPSIGSLRRLPQLDVSYNARRIHWSRARHAAPHFRDGAPRAGHLRSLAALSCGGGGRIPSAPIAHKRCWVRTSSMPPEIAGLAIKGSPISFFCNNSKCGPALTTKTSPSSLGR